MLGELLLWWFLFGGSASTPTPPPQAGQCPSTRTFAGGEDVWQCRLDDGHPPGHLGLPQALSRMVYSIQRRQPDSPRPT